MLLLPLYLDYLEASRAEIGAIMGSAAIGGLAVRPLVGWALDTVGRKSTITVGTLFLAAAMGMIYLVEAPGPMVFAARIVFGVGVAGLFTGYFAFAADIVPEERRTEGLALFGISGIAPLAINPIAAYAGVNPPDLRWFLPAMGGVILLSLIPLMAVPEAKRTKTGPGLTFRSVARALLRRRLAPIWFATFAFSGLAKIFMAFATVAAENRDIPVPADFWLTYAAGAITVRLFGAQALDRIGPVRLVAPAIGLQVIAAVAMAHAHTTELLMFGGLLAGIAHGYGFPVITSLVVSRSPEAMRGSALAMFTALWEVTALVLPPVLGWIGDLHGDDILFLCAASGGAVMIAGWIGLERRLGGVA